MRTDAPSAHRLAGHALLILLLWVGAGSARAGDPSLPAPPRPDYPFYERHLASWIEASCVECHRLGGGALRLGEGPDAATTRRLDFERLRAFVNPEAPWESRLYLKLLEPADGGDPHLGGAFLRRDDELHDTVLDFVSGATLDNLAPEVWFEHAEVRTRPGEAIFLDGRGAFDRDRSDMEGLAFRWALIARPAESRALVSDLRASRVEFVPDTGGTYVVSLRVSDGKVWSAPRALTIEVFQHNAVKAAEPGGISGLDRVDEAALRRLRRVYLDVLGRPPTVSEVLAEEKSGVRGLVRNVLLRAESGRAWAEEVSIRLGLYDEFRPTGGEASDVALRIPSESLLPHEVEAVFVTDPAFLLRHPPGRSLAEAVGHLLLGRAPLPAERTAARQLAEGQPATLPGIGEVRESREWLVKLTASDEFQRAALQRRLERFLPSGDVTRLIESALGASRRGRQEFRAYLEEALVEPAYLDRRQLRLKDPLTYLRSVFVDLLERKPTDRELVALVRALGNMPAGGGAQAALVKVLIDSGEVPLPLLVDITDGPLWMTDRFLRYLGRRPTSAEMQIYGKALLHPMGGPELVVLGLLTGAEYACR